MCPINYGTISTLGLTNESQITIKIITKDSITFSQNQSIPPGAKLTNVPNQFKIVDTTFGYSVLSAKGLAFDVVQQIGTFSIIKLWNYKRSSSKTKDQISEYTFYENYYSENVYNLIPKQITGIRPLELDSTNSSNKSVDPSKDYYLVKTDDLNEKSEEFDYEAGTWNLGSMYLPVKLRPFATKSASFDFTSDFAVGTSVSYTFHHNIKNDWTTNLLIYAGVSSIKVDSAVANDLPTNAYKTTQNITAFSPAIGLYWEKANIQIGFVVGMDFPAGTLQKTWVYRNMPWIGLSAGVSLFKITNNTSSKAGNN